MSNMDQTAILSRQIMALDAGPEFLPFSKVTYYWTGTDGQEESVSVGVDSGRELRIPLNYSPANSGALTTAGTALLARFSGKRYRPMSAEGAALNPAAEIGDGITAGGIYSGIYATETDFGRRMAATVEAPADEETVHECGFMPEKAETRYIRQVAAAAAQLRVDLTGITGTVTRIDGDLTALESSVQQTAAQISAQVAKKVSADGTATKATFGWKLDANGFYLYGNNKAAMTVTQNEIKMYANGTQVLKVDGSGLELQGLIKATAGQIANFTIHQDAFRMNGGEYQPNGIYIGSGGILVGKHSASEANFYVTPSGDMVANSATIRGQVDCTMLYVNGQAITPAILQAGIAGGRIMQDMQGLNTNARIRCSQLFYNNVQYYPLTIRFVTPGGASAQAVVLAQG